MVICRGLGSKVVALLAAVLLAACASAEPNEPKADPQDPLVSPSAISSVPSEPLEPGDLEAPPPVTVRFFEESIELHAWTYCYRNGCADGAPPANPPDVGSPDEISVEFALSGWSFNGSFTRAGRKCGRVQTVPLQPVGDGRFVLRPAGFAATYDVTLFAEATETSSRPLGGPHRPTDRCHSPRHGSPCSLATTVYSTVMASSWN
jgi:hypothetical protein